jgi:hypothetical protein
MHRRGISEAVTAVLLLAVIATVSYFALGGSVKRTIDNERTITDAISLKGFQVQELISIISTKITDTTTFELINYGPNDIIIDKVFLDGNSLPFTVSDSNGDVFLNNTISPKEIMVLQVDGVGNSIQLITDSKNMISIPLD